MDQEPRKKESRWQRRIKTGEWTKKRIKNSKKRRLGGTKRGWKIWKLLVNNNHCKKQKNHMQSRKGVW